MDGHGTQDPVGWEPGGGSPAPLEDTKVGGAVNGVEGDAPHEGIFSPQVPVVIMGAYLPVVYLSVAVGAFLA